MPPPTTTPPPPPSFPLNLLPGAVFVLLPFLFLFRALLGAHARHNSSSSSTPEEEAASSSSSSSSSSVRRLKKKHVRWLLGPFRFQALPSRAMAALFRCLGEGSTGASALATTNAAIRTAVLRAQSTLTIAGGKAAAADEEEEGALLALLCRLSPDALTTVRIKRKGVATTVFLDALLEGPSVMPALFGPSLQEVSLDLSGCAKEEVIYLFECLAPPDDDDAPLPAPNLTQLLLRNMPISEDEDEDDEGPEDESIASALAGMVERRAARGAAPLQRLAGGIWQADPASLRRVIRVVLPSVRWLECGGGE